MPDYFPKISDKANQFVLINPDLYTQWSDIYACACMHACVPYGVSVHTFIACKPPT